MKQNWNKIMALTLAFTVVSGTAVYADVMKGETTTSAVLAETTAEENTSAYTATTGTISEISESQDGNQVITIENETGGLRFVVAAGTVIADRESGSIATADTLTDGMSVTVIYGINSPMGMSMPPYLGSVTAVIANADQGAVSVGYFNDELLNQADLLQLNISEETNILTTLGTRSILSADDIKGKNAAVFYDVTTRSIPAQTTPSLVLLLEERTETVPEETDTPDAVSREVTTQQADSMVALRDAVEAKGYTVTWQGKTAPVLLEKDNLVSEITLGSTTYVVEGDMAMIASAAPVLTDGILYVSADVLEHL